MSLDTAILAKLQGAAAVTAAAPGGVYWDVAPAGAETDAQGNPRVFVIVGLQAHTDEYAMSGGHFEVGRYLVKAIGQGENSLAVATASSAIYAALQDQPLTSAGYTHMQCHREERIRYVEVDGSVRWQHSGGIYAVWMAA